MYRRPRRRATATRGRQVARARPRARRALGQAAPGLLDRDDRAVHPAAADLGHDQRPGRACRAAVAPWPASLCGDRLADRVGDPPPTSRRATYRPRRRRRSARFRSSHSSRTVTSTVFASGRASAAPRRSRVRIVEVDRAARRTRRARPCAAAARTASSWAASRRRAGRRHANRWSGGTQSPRGRSVGSRRRASGAWRREPPRPSRVGRRRTDESGSSAARPAPSAPDARPSRRRPSATRGVQGRRSVAIERRERAARLGAERVDLVREPSRSRLRRVEAAVDEGVAAGGQLRARRRSGGCVHGGDDPGRAEGDERPRRRARRRAERGIGASARGSAPRASRRWRPRTARSRRPRPRNRSIGRDGPARRPRRPGAPPPARGDAQGRAASPSRRLAADRHRARARADPRHRRAARLDGHVRGADRPDAVHRPGRAAAGVRPADRAHAGRRGPRADHAPSSSRPRPRTACATSRSAGVRCSTSRAASPWPTGSRPCARARATAAARTGTVVRLICTALRSHDPDGERRRSPRPRRASVDRGLTGWDLAGPEEAYPDPLDHARAFEAARANGLRITTHAGEWGGAAQVRRALDVTPERIAHGPVAIDDPELCAELRGPRRDPGPVPDLELAGRHRAVGGGRTRSRGSIAPVSR